MLFLSHVGTIDSLIGTLLLLHNPSVPQSPSRGSWSLLFALTFKTLMALSAQEYHLREKHPTGGHMGAALGVDSFWGAGWYRTASCIPSVGMALDHTEKPSCQPMLHTHVFESPDSQDWEPLGWLHLSQMAWRSSQWNPVFGAALFWIFFFLFPRFTSLCLFLLPQHSLLHHVSTHPETSSRAVLKGHPGICHSNHEES